MGELDGEGDRLTSLAAGKNNNPPGGVPSFISSPFDQVSLVDASSDVDKS
jgi:hypothetical protein